MTISSRIYSLLYKLRKKTVLFICLKRHTVHFYIKKEKNERQKTQIAASVRENFN